MCPSNQLPPPVQSEVEREFYDFLKRPENRGFNKGFAAWLGEDSEAYVSRMHSPHVPETPSWLYKAALDLDRACKVNPAVGKKALEILTRVVARYAERPATERTLDATFYTFKAALAAYEDGELTPEKFETARNELVETVARVGVPERVVGQQFKV